MSNNSNYSKTFQMTQKELREYLKGWEKDNPIDLEELEELYLEELANK